MAARVRRTQILDSDQIDYLRRYQEESFDVLSFNDRHGMMPDDKAHFLSVLKGHLEEKKASSEMIKSAMADVFEYRENPYRSVVYFLYAHGAAAMKIGWTCDLMTRLRAIQLYNPYGLEVDGLLAATRVTEKAIHFAFSHLRLNGEWFAWADELQSFVRLLSESSVEEQFSLMPPVGPAAKQGFCVRCGHGGDLWLTPHGMRCWDCACRSRTTNAVKPLYVGPCDQAMDDYGSCSDCRQETDLWDCGGDGCLCRKCATIKSYENKVTCGNTTHSAGNLR